MISREEMSAGIISEIERLDIIRSVGPYEALAGGRIAIFSYLFGGIEGKRILDIGCGGRKQERGFGEPTMVYGEGYEPHFCRMAQRVGAYPVGIDPRVDTQEGFESHRLSIFDELGLPKESFDGVLVSLFWSDSRVFRNGKSPRVSQTHVYRKIKDLLKPGGYSVNVGNGDRRSREPNLVLSNNDFEALGFDVVGYFGFNEIHLIGGEDLIVLRKPLVVETL